MRRSRSGAPDARALAVAVLVAGVSAVLLAGCGMTRPPTTTTAAASSRHKRRTTPTRSAVPLTLRLVGGAAFPGFHGILIPTTITSAAVWEADAGLAGPHLHRAAETLERLGFLAGVRQTLYGQARSSTEVISIVEQFRSATGARAELVRSQPRGPGIQPLLAVHTFPIPTIPGALGTTTTAPFASSQSVAFDAGRYYYQVAVITPHVGGASPNRTQLIAATTALYQRYHKQLNAWAA